ncbi:hypothetical protein Q8F55_009172 [Vanrija albida]|uniref:histidine kinase n=1 Tax=Vanrija albida TaxID=181172 RepID=A0ABR3PSX5_9TREE
MPAVAPGNIRFHGRSLAAHRLRHVASSVSDFLHSFVTAPLPTSSGSSETAAAPREGSPSQASTPSDPLGMSGSEGASDEAPRRGAAGGRPKIRRASTGMTRSSRGSRTTPQIETDDPKADAPPPGPVHFVVVDNDFEQLKVEVGAGIDADQHSSHEADSEEHEPSRPTTGLWHKNDGSQANTGTHPSRSVSESSSFKRQQRSACTPEGLSDFVRHRMVPAITHFMSQSFPEAAKERLYLREAWYSEKQGALLCSMFFIISWILSNTLQLPLDKFQLWAYVGLAGAFTVALPFAVALDGPLRFPWLYQVIVWGAVWPWGILISVEMHNCGYFQGVPGCGQKLFLYYMGILMGFPSIAIMAMRQNRLFHLLGVVSYFIAAGCLLFNQPSVPRLFYRNPAMFGLYHAFLVGTSYVRERNDRQLFQLRQQLKMQYRAVQAAQVMERKAEESKKRFVSYIFHEVRVPLNTALLAVQNLEGEGVFRQLGEGQSDMVHGLMGSLAMMEKVLNDVLSFNRMESGRFVQARKPFDFHKSIQLVALSHQVQAELNNVEFKVELDPRIDMCGGLFIGDEMRLRQITSNLVSNALKFTHSGSVRVVTKLKFPTFTLPALPRRRTDSSTVVPSGENSKVTSPLGAAFDEEHVAKDDPERGSLSMESRRQSLIRRASEPASRSRSPYAKQSPRLRSTASHAIPPELQRNFSYGTYPLDGVSVPKVVVRVEVHDTGVGLRPEDVSDNRLFSPYVQTEIGRRQGGKGSGLGLALVRQIVKLSGGRLGVDSQTGVGSVFWFELPYAVLVNPPAAADAGGAPGDGGSKGDDLLKGSGSPEAQFPHGSTSAPASASPSAQASPTTSRMSSKPGMGRVPASAWTEARRPSTASEEAAYLRAIRKRGSESSATEDSSNPSSSSTTNDSAHGPSPLRRSGPEVPPSSTPRRSLSAGAVPLSSSSPAPSPPLDTPGVPAMTMAPESTTVSFRPVDWNYLPSSPSPLHSSSGHMADNASRLQHFHLPPVSTIHETPEGQPRPSPDMPLDTQQLSSPPASALLPDGQVPLSALVVDDDVLTRKLMSRMLRRLGHEVTTADNGLMALEMIKASFEPDATTRYDIVFLDNQMPKMTGVEVAAEVRRLGLPLFIVGCTGNALREDQDEYLAAGADDLLPKPVHQANILEMIEAARARMRERAEDARRSASPPATSSTPPAPTPPTSTPPPPPDI